MCRQFGAEDDLADLRVWLTEGAFYNTWTPAPSRPALEQSLREAQEQRCAAVLVPTVRSEATAFADERLVRIPAYVESAIEFGNDLAESLRSSIGSRRYLDFRRLARRTESSCDVRFVRATDAAPEFLDDVARLHGLNARKYGHPIDFYDRDVLDWLRQGPLSTSLHLALVTRRSDNRPVQAMIVIDDAATKSVAFLVQGHEESDELRPLHLYSYAYWSMYEWAAARGRERVFLARGKHEDKARLGANRFWISENWIFSEDPHVLRRARALADRGRAIITVHPPNPNDISQEGK